MNINDFALGYPTQEIKGCLAVNADAMDWLDKAPEESIHAIVTDPPYGLREFEEEHVDSIKAEDGDEVWQTFRYADGSERAVQPCFSTLNDKDRKRIAKFFVEFSKKALRVLKPGGHLIIANHVSLSNLCFPAIEKGGFQFRGTIIRLVCTLRGGDKPPGAQTEFPDCCTLPRSLHEPWGLFRKPFTKGLTIPEALRKHGTGALRRLDAKSPCPDVIRSNRPSKAEVEIAQHPNLKPQSLMRKLVRVALPLGKGIIVDPFMGSGSTVAAGIFNEYQVVGIEKNPDFYKNALQSIPRLADKTPFLDEPEDGSIPAFSFENAD